MQSARDVNARGEDLEPWIIEHGGVRKYACCNCMLQKGKNKLPNIYSRCISENIHLIGHGLYYVEY